MGFLHILTFLSLAVVVSHAAVVPETYWKTVLPNTPMPKAVTDLLPNDKSTDIHVRVGKGGASVHAPGTNIGTGGNGGVSIHARGTNVVIGKGGGVSIHSPSTHVGAGKGGVSVHAPSTNVGVSKDVFVNAPGTHVSIGKGGVSIHAPRTNVDVGNGGISVHAPGTKVGSGKGGVSVHAPGTKVGSGKGGVSVHAPGTKVGSGKGGVSVHAPGTKVGSGKGGVSVHAPGTNVGAGKGGLSVHAPGTNIGVSKDVSVNVPGTHVSAGKGGVSVNSPGTNVGGGKGGVSVHVPGTKVGAAGNGGVSVHAPGITNVGVSKDVSVNAPSTHVGVGNGGVSVHAPGTNVGVGKGGGVTVHAPKPKPKGDCTKVTVGKGGVVVRCHNKKKPVHVKVDPFSYKYAATDDQLKDDPNVALFFLEKEMHQGNSMNLHFTKITSPTSTFLPREVADKIPFSSKKLPELYTRFSLKPDTIESESMKKTINECEDKGMEGEKKYCATSLEAMVDFSTSELGKKVKAITTEVNSIKPTPLQKYTIEGAKKLAANKAVVCHKQKYPYAVFYCHKTTVTKAYAVSLVGEDATKAKAVAVCHTDTAKWNPKHLAFRVLKVKPGTTPVCHFLPEDHVVWVPY